MLGEQACNRVGRGGGLEPAHGSRAVRARRDVHLEDVPQEPGPWASAWLGVAAVVVVTEQLELHHAGGQARDLGFGHDLAPNLRVRAEHTVVAHHVQPRWRDERTDPCDQIERLEQERNRAVLPWLLEGVPQLAARGFLEVPLRRR